MSVYTENDLVYDTTKQGSGGAFAGGNYYQGATLTIQQMYVQGASLIADAAKIETNITNIQKEVESDKAIIDGYKVTIAQDKATIDGYYQDIKFIEQKVTVTYTDIQRIEANVVTLSNNAATSATNASGSETNACTSAESALLYMNNSKDLRDGCSNFETECMGYAFDAAQSYQNCLDVYEALSKGQVYRGTWNVQDTLSYPDPQGTNSTWDVVTNDRDFVWNGITWTKGDRLIYTLEGNKYFHIELPDGVLSVNGQTGNVNLNAADVSAVSTSYGWGSKQAYTVTNADSSPVTWLSGGMGVIRFISTTVGKIAQGQGILTRYQSNDSQTSYTLLFQAVDATWTRYWTVANGWSVWNRLYDEQHTPTATEVGALPNTGDKTKTVAVNNIVASEERCLTKEGNNNHGVYLGDDGRAVVGSSDSGSVTLRPNGLASTVGQFVISSNGDTNSSGQTKEQGQRVYSPNNKPTASTLGVYTKAEVDALLANQKPPEAYPVGSVYIAVNTVNPATALGYGTWSLVQEGASVQSSRNGLGTVTGSNTQAVPVPAHSHTGGSLNQQVGSFGIIAPSQSNAPMLYGGSLGVSIRDAGQSINKHVGTAASTRSGAQSVNIEVRPNAWSGTTNSTGTANATMNVSGMNLNVYMWIRTA